MGNIWLEKPRKGLLHLPPPPASPDSLRSHANPAAPLGKDWINHTQFLLEMPKPEQSTFLISRHMAVGKTWDTVLKTIMSLHPAHT